MILQEEILMVVNEGPKQTIPNLAPGAFFVVGHFENVVRSREVRLCGENASIGELAHAINITQS